MKTSNHCTCHTEPDLCGAGVLERPRYFPGEILTPAEMTLEQQYFRDKLRRHNRLIHGWGVVCGAAVCRVPEEQAARDTRWGTAAAPGRPAPTSPGTASPARPSPKPWKVRVAPGYILGPYGDEILIDREVILDLRTCGQAGVTGEHGEPADPWCADVYVEREPGPLYVAVRYKEVLARPVRVQPGGCGCDETQCEYSRWRDGYEICVLTECPPSHENPPDLERLFQGPLLDCPACPPDPWVVLARVEIDDEGAITALDNCSCRRNVVSFGHFWWRCTGDACAIQSVEVEGGRSVEAGTDFVIDVRAYDLPDTVTADLGPQVTVKTATVSDNGTRLRIEARAEAGAEPGARTLEIRDTTQNRVIAARRNAVEIRTAAAQPPAPQPSQPNAPQPGGPAPPIHEATQDTQAKQPRGKGKAGGK